MKGVEFICTMISLSLISCLLGILLLALHLPAVLFTKRYQQGLNAFPRNEWAGKVQTAIALIWVGWIILHTHLGRFEHLKPAVYVVAPLAFLLVVYFLDELLASRALGGLLLLLGDPVLDVARWHESSLRLVVTLLIYVWVIAGTVLVLSPYRFRTFVEFWTISDQRFRAGASLGLGVGLVLVGLGVWVY